MDVLLFTTLGVSQDNIGEHGALVTAVANTFSAQQTGGTFNNIILRVLFCELIVH